MLSKPAHRIHTALWNGEVTVCASTLTPSSGVSQVKVWPRPPPHTFTSVSHRPSCSPTLSVNNNEAHCMPGGQWKPIPEASTNLGGESSICIGWDESVFLMKYWLLVRLFQDNWCQWSSHCLRISWVLVSKVNCGIPFSEIPTHRPCRCPGNLRFNKHFQDVGGAWVALWDTLISTTSDVHTEVHHWAVCRCYFPAVPSVFYK